MGIGVEEYQRRLKAVRARMVDQELDALLIYSWKRGQVRYLTGYTPDYIANVAAVVLPLESEPAMFIRFPFDLERARLACWFETVHASGDLSGIGRDVVRCFHDCGLGGGARIGLVTGDGVMDELPYTLYQQIDSGLPQVEWVDARGLVMDARLIKSPAEFAALRQSAQVADAAVEAARSVIKSGTEEFQVAAAVESAARFRHATAWLSSMAGRASRDLIGPPESEALPDDDMTIVEFAVEVQGYWTQVARTFAPGQPMEQQRAIYHAVYSAYRAEVKACRPGATLGDIARAAEASFAASGFAGFSEHDYGHGIGLDMPEPPRIGIDDTATVQPGMAMVLHPAVRVPGIGGAFVGGTVLVHPDQTEEIHAIPADLPEQVA
ncbi:MAG TPA: Xaa-Pro peptidase family protein [Aggregatilineaceae bacterium]|nr:Xaa-Pro peptidase family protein [Aggregatilineaceae bacterium]